MKTPIEKYERIDRFAVLCMHEYDTSGNIS